MPDDIEINEDTLTSDTTNESVETNLAKVAELNQIYETAAESGNQSAYTQIEEAKIAEVTSTSIELDENIAGQNGISFPDTKETVGEFDDTLRTDIVPADISDPTVRQKAAAAEAKLSTEYRTFKKAALKSMGNAFRTKLLKGVTSDTSSKLGPELDKAEQLGQTVNKLLEDPTSSKDDVQKALDDYDKQGQSIQKIIESDSDYKNKIESKVGSEGMKLVYKLAYMLGILAGILGSIWIALSIFAKSLTGCYMYYNQDGVSDSYLLLGCSDYYSEEANQYKCACGNKVPLNSSPLSNPDCTKLGVNECGYPYCLGRCDSTDATKPPVCGGFATGQNLQCTTGTIADKGYVSYGYKAYTPSSLLGAGLTALGNLPGDIGNFLSTLFQGILKYGLIILAIIIFLVVVWILIKKFVLEKSSNK